MNRFLRMTAVVLAAAFAFLLAGCGGSSASTSFTWFVNNIPANLDPQVATKAEDVIACENLYGGLVRRNASGELVPDLCERWEISSDGLTYTFYLKSGLTYTGTKGAATDYAITAEDFVYAFRRVFDPQTASPYAVEFSAIQNSAAVRPRHAGRVGHRRTDAGVPPERAGRHLPFQTHPAGCHAL